MDFLLRFFRFFMRFDRACHVDSFKPEAMLKNEQRSLCFSYFVAALTIWLFIMRGLSQGELKGIKELFAGFAFIPTILLNI
jgi:hypothetical protein